MVVRFDGLRFQFFLKRPQKERYFVFVDRFSIMVHAANIPESMTTQG